MTAHAIPLAIARADILILKKLLLVSPFLKSPIKSGSLYLVIQNWLFHLKAMSAPRLSLGRGQSQ